MLAHICIYCYACSLMLVLGLSRQSLWCLVLVLCLSYACFRQSLMLVLCCLVLVVVCLSYACLMLVLMLVLCLTFACLLLVSADIKRMQEAAPMSGNGSDHMFHA